MSWTTSWPSSRSRSPLKAKKSRFYVLCCTIILFISLFLYWMNFCVFLFLKSSGYIWRNATMLLSSYLGSIFGERLLGQWRSEFYFASTNVSAGGTQNPLVIYLCWISYCAAMLIFRSQSRRKDSYLVIRLLMSLMSFWSLRSDDFFILRLLW